MSFKIPVMDDPLGKCWGQPEGLRDRVQVYETHATIHEDDWRKLHDYSASFPSGVYPGKVWKSGKWLRWYGPDRNGKCKAACVRALIQGKGKNLSVTTP